jgi:hypothetical protein
MEAADLLGLASLSMQSRDTAPFRALRLTAMAWRLPHEPTCPVMRKHPGFEYFAPQPISDSGDITFFSTGNALARPEVRQRLAQILFGPRL